MKWPQRLAYKLYFFFFLWICLGDLLVLVFPETEAYIYYHTMQTLLPASVMFLHYALLRASVDILCLGVLFAYAFNLKPAAGWFWRPLFLARIATALTGHNYELQSLKSAFYGEKGLLLATLIIYGLLVLPSYYAHYLYAFGRAKEKAPASPVQAAN
jgi:hypothetical protein